MQRPVTNTLVKIFVKGFYKEHLGFLVFLFAVIFSHLFWMKPLGGHLSPEESLYHHLIMLISFASNPVMMIFYFVIWLVYSIKSWTYVEKHLKVFEQQFLFYSITSLSRFRQFQCWFNVQGIILLPAVIFGLAAVVVGIAFNYYVIPIIIVLYLFLLTNIGAIIYVYLVNVPLKPDPQSIWLKLVSNWKKPFFSLFIYYVFDKMKLGYLFTKFLSWATITGGFLGFYDFKDDSRIAAIVILLVTICHAFFVYQSQRFEDVYLKLSRNFPFSRTILFLNFAVVYLILIFPEIIWMVYQFHFNQSIELIGFSLSTALVFRSLACFNSTTINNFVIYVFVLFILYFIAIMFGFITLISILNLSLAFLTFYKSYYTGKLGF